MSVCPKMVKTMLVRRDDCGAIFDSTETPMMMVRVSLARSR
jgi:hypothetical protein